MVVITTNPIKTFRQELA